MAHRRSCRPRIVAYAATGRIEAAIAAHFAVNALWFVGFTTPHLAR